MKIWTLYHVDFDGNPIGTLTYPRKAEALSAFDNAAVLFARGDLAPAVVEVCLYDPNDELIRSTQSGPDDGGDGQGDYPNPGELRRMAQRAVQHGMTLRVLTQRGRVDHFVLDPRDHSASYVTAASCSCAQFVACGGCQHHSLLVDSIGWILEAVAAVELESGR